MLALSSTANAAPLTPNRNSHSSADFEPRPRKHVSPVTPEEATNAMGSESSVETAEATLPLERMAPTRSSFLAIWKPVSGAAGYRIDVSTDPAFKAAVSGYRDLDAGNVLSRIVCRLQPATKYYYRVRPYNSAGTGANSEVMTAATTSGSGLVINPTFDTSITSNPNAAAIESTINQAIALYQPLFSDPVTAEIRFRYSTTGPDGSPFPSGAVAESYYVVYYIPWSDYIAGLKADAKTTNDTAANADLPSLPITPDLVPSSADGRAIGLDTPPAMFADGTVGSGGTYDGIVTLNSSEPFQFTRPPSSGNFDARRFTEHEMDEVLGLGSYLGGSPEDTEFRPQDLFSWSAPGQRSHAAVGARYFSINNGITHIVNFNQNPSGDYGDWESEACPQISPYVQNAFGCMGQIADVTATSPEGINLDVVGYDLIAAIPPPPTVLGNISTRLEVETGDNVLIGGFIITGTQPKELILRAIGPSLPLGGTLADPTLELHDSTGAIIASNDNWRSTQEQAIIATGVAPVNDAESAIVMTLNPGDYTAIVRGANGGTGIGLVEAYDLDQSVDSKLANISTRGLVQTGDNVLIGGFIVLGESPAKTILRAIGPSLSIPGALADPTLELHDGNGTLLMSNDDWKTDQESEIIATGIAPTKAAESAIVATLAPGNYTAIVRGKNNSTGIALVEVYQLNN